MEFILFQHKDFLQEKNIIQIISFAEKLLIWNNIHWICMTKKCVQENLASVIFNCSFEFNAIEKDIDNTSHATEESKLWNVKSWVL